MRALAFVQEDVLRNDGLRQIPHDLAKLLEDQTRDTAQD